MNRPFPAANFEKLRQTGMRIRILIRKDYLVDMTIGVVAGMYLWKDRTDAEKWHGEAFRNMVQEIYGSEPEIQIFETPIVEDNVAGTIAKVT